MGTVIFLDEKIDWGSQEAHHLFVGNWFDLKQYHKYYMSYFSKGLLAKKGPQKEQLTEIRLWMQDNLEGEIIIKYDDQSHRGHGRAVYLYFQHETDMMAFKLRWEE